MTIQSIIIFIVSVIAGYYFFLYLSHPSKKKNRLPKIGIWNIEFLPNFRLHIGSKTYHLHHWFILALLILIPFLLTERFIYPTVFKGILVGGIFQGLRYPNRFKFRYPRIPKFADWEKYFLQPQPKKEEKKS
jgi:hypothetical protein